MIGQILLSTSLLTASTSIQASAPDKPGQQGTPPAAEAPLPAKPPRDGNLAGDAEARASRPMSPYKAGDIELDDAFWGPVLRTNRRQTLMHCWAMCDKTGRISNFQRAAGKAQGPHQGQVFDDSDVYKLVEGTAYAVRDSKDEFMEMRLIELANTIAAAQRPDGYLNTWFQLGDFSSRWTDLPTMHELYCLGHLIEAGVAHWESLGGRVLLDAGKRASAHIGSTFGPGMRREVCGHPEIELALQRLYDVTGAPADRDLATWFLEERGRSEGRPSAGEFAQDHRPLREQTEAVGHAVRAMYLYTAATRLARESGDEELAAAMRRLFEDVTQRKMYLTGGIGSSSANEGFTSPHDLPNDDAYAETCAAIGLMLWAQQMHLMDRDARPIDVLERALYNAVRGGVSLDGVKFFYSNPLASDGSRHRQSWFDCACCPPNILRILGRLSEFVASRDGETVYINLYIQSTVGFAFERAGFQITQRTDYPWDGAIKLWVVGTKPAIFTLALRIPSWAEGATITIDGKPVSPDELVMERGYARIRREWDGNNTVQLTLPMAVRVTEADPRVQAQTGRFALERGPLVYCVEGEDSAPDLRALVFDPAGPLTLERRPDLLGGVTAIVGAATRPATGGRPAEPVPFSAVPFYAWNNRSPGPMLVWLPESPAAAEHAAATDRTIAASARGAQDSLQALADGQVPDGRSPRFTWWPRQGSVEWVQYNFVGPRTVDEVELVWFDDLDQGGSCSVPESVTVKVRRTGSQAWEDVATLALERPAQVAGTGVGAPRSTLRFPAVEIEAIRVESTLREGRSGGLLEWEVRSGT